MRYPFSFNYAASVRPPLTFVAVPGTRMDQLVAQIGPQYKERGTSPTAWLAPWIGCALRGDDLIFIATGGHNDCTFNGGQAYNWRSQTWRLLFQPSDYSDAVWQESRQLYIAAGLNPDAYNVTRPFTPGGDAVWKDGKQVSQHCWGFVVDAQEFGVFHLRSGSWRYDPVTWQGTKLLGAGSLGEHGPDGYAYYLPSTKKIYVCADNIEASRYGQISQVDPTTGAWTLIMENGAWQWYEAEACQMEDGRVFRFSRLTNVAAIVDFAARTVTNIPTLSDLFTTDPLIALMHSNKTGVLALCSSGNLSSIDLATGRVVLVGPSGIPAALLSGAVKANHTWGRLKLVTNGAVQKFVFPIETNSDVFEMAI